MSDILTRLAALTQPDCPEIETQAQKLRESADGRRATSWAMLDPPAKGYWLAKAREAALIALVREAAEEIQRLRRAASHGLSALEAIHKRCADRYFVETSSDEVARYMKRAIKQQEAAHG